MAALSALPRDKTTPPASRWRYVVVGNRVALESAADSNFAEQFGAKPFGRFGDEVVFRIPAAQAERFADELVRDAEGAPRAAIVASPPKIVDRSALFRRAFADRSFESTSVDGPAWNHASSPPARPRLPVARWAIALGILAVAIAATRPRLRAHAAAWLSRQPHLALAAVGLSWWLLLWPGWIGLVIVAISIASAWRLTWPLPSVTARARPSHHA
jgi:hypothetical protein